MPVGEPAADHLLAEIERGLVERIGERTGVGSLETAREVVEGAAVDAEDDVGATGQEQAQGVFVVALDAAAQIVSHAASFTGFGSGKLDCGKLARVRVVLDTNVLISGLWTPDGLEAQVVKLAMEGRIALCCSREIWAEYRDVLSRDKFLALRERAADLLDGLERRAVWVAGGERVSVASDEDDNRFLECAMAAGAACLVTGNQKHYPAEWGATKVVNAREFLRMRRSLLGSIG